MLTLEVRFIRLPLRRVLALRPRHCRSLKLRYSPERTRSRNEKGNLSYLAIIQYCARLYGCKQNYH
jgi:hypothetical protein